WSLTTHAMLATLTAPFTSSMAAWLMKSSLKRTWSSRRKAIMIELRNLEKFYETGVGKTFVLRRISLDIKQGDFLTIMGPSGAGKSTLLAILGMLDSNWIGEYYFLGEPVHKLKPKDRVELNKRYIGFVFQQYHLLDSLTVYENLD